jgi:hypothetical protein
MRVAFIIVSVLWLAGCGSVPSKIDLRPGIAACEAVDGLRGLRIYVSHTGEDTKFEFRGDKLSRTSVNGDLPLSRIPRNDSGMNWLENIEERFPREPGRLSNGDQLGFPAASSPDGRSWAAAIVTGSAKRTNGLVIRHGSDIKRLRNLPGFSLETLAWSQGSNMLAAIESRSTTEASGLKDVFSPHPVPYSDIVVTVYRATGESVCQSILMQNARYATARVEWVRP